MKKIIAKSIILLTLLSFLIFPTVALASWWNPFSWGIWNNIFHKADTKTQILENKVKELESKLNEQPTSTPAVTETNKATNTEANQQATQQSAQKATQQAAAQAATAKAAQQATAQAAAQAAQQAAAQQAAQQAAAQAAAQAQAAQQAAAQAAQQAAADKQAKLDAVNLEIANLNAKYAQDIKDCDSRQASMSFIYACENQVTRTYNSDYNTLAAKFQQIKYGN